MAIILNDYNERGVVTPEIFFEEVSGNEELEELKGLF